MSGETHAANFDASWHVAGSSHCAFGQSSWLSWFIYRQSSSLLSGYMLAEPPAGITAHTAVFNPETLITAV